MGKRKTTAEFISGGKRLVMMIDRCGMCGVYGYYANRMVQGDDAHADLVLKELPAMIVRKVDREGREYDPVCLECMDNRMFPDNEPKVAKK